ncbi:MAG: TonB-dependent receptor, partial [Acidobacteriota bacterium]
QPSRQNEYGVTASGPLGSIGYLTVGIDQNKVRGMVNGNVLVPLESERVPLAEDPAVRDIVQGFLNAYPDELPNRTDFDTRALNTNSPQNVDRTVGRIRLDLPFNDRQNLTASFHSDRQRVDAFQFVAGQNPDTEIHGSLGRVSHRIDFSSKTLAAFSARFQRTKSLLKPEPNAVGPRVRLGSQIQELGPESEFPVDRTQSALAFGGTASHISADGNHTLTFGGHLYYGRLSGIETNDIRGYFQFSNQFGRTAIENLLYGTPSRYIVTIGDIYRQFRNWRGQFFIGDQWRLSQRLHLTYGLRYGFQGTPVEMEGRDLLPFGCDCNNFAPRLAIAFRLSDAFALRSSYTVSFGEIYAVTYQQIRNNAPAVRQYQVQNPSLLDPLEGIDTENPTSRYSPTQISPDLVAPYSHQYNLSLERKFNSGIFLRLGYLGSRTLKPFKAYVLNRAEIVEGIPQLPSTIDARRADPRFAEVYNIANGGIGYVDAAQVSVGIPYRTGISLTATYTFSKAIDLGTSYTSTAANQGVTRGRNQDQYDAFGDQKGLSNFDSPHALLIYYSWELPELTAGAGWLRSIATGWKISGTALAKKGTPFTLFNGSDALGYGNVDGSTGDRPNILDPSILGASFSHPDTSASILTRDRFIYILPGEIRGDLGRNTFRKGPIKNLNLALSRQFSFTKNGEAALQFRIEAYNLTNSPQFDEPQRNLSAPSFGRITNTLNDGRVFQIGLELGF